MRIKLTNKNTDVLRSAILKSTHSMKSIADKLHIHPRTINDWLNAESTIPYLIFKQLVDLTKLTESELSPKKLTDYWHIKKAAKKGAFSRYKLYGNPGTTEGRKLGGFRSLKTHRRKATGFSTEKDIIYPKKSESLAELIGILFGDGHLSHYQASMTTNSKTDRDHFNYTRSQIKKIFGITGYSQTRVGENSLTLVVSSIKLVKFLNHLGMPIGHKIQGNIRVPNWIFLNKNYSKSFIRGLFDTDGCIYVDHHRIKKCLYKHLGWTITSYAQQLPLDIIKILQNLGFSPTYRTTQKSVYLRKQEEIKHYFDIVGTHNPKHLKRYLRGRVPKWS